MGQPLKARTTGRTRDPQRSRCLKGSRVMRPASRAVGSPFQEAVNPWADSWKETAKSSRGRSTTRRINNFPIMGSIGGVYQTPPPLSRRRLSFLRFEFQDPSFAGGETQDFRPSNFKI